MTPAAIGSADVLYPSQLRERLGTQAPKQLIALGNLDLLNLKKTALFCSAKCPSNAILAAYDQAAKWREAGRCVISGFHSPIEKECLSILFRGKQPIIICPARSIENMRIPSEWKSVIEEQRMLLLSCFGGTQSRVTSDLATQRNEIVAALADDAWFAHISPGGKAERLTQRLIEWKIPFSISGTPNRASV